MREIRLSGLEGGVADIRHPYPYCATFLRSAQNFTGRSAGANQRLMAAFL